MLPSGMMIVNTGLLVRVRNEAQLAAVLGHEAGHYFRRHALDLHRDMRRKSGLTEAAIDAVKQWKFKPATLDNRPVSVYFTLTVNFQLQ